MDSGTLSPPMIDKTTGRQYSMPIGFEWDNNKAASNIRDHAGVTFEQAATAFSDPFAVEWLDKRQDYGEERSVLGRSYGFGDWAKPNKASKRPLTQASLRCKRWLKPSSLHRIPTPLKRCWISHLQALSTIPEPSGKPRAL